MPAAVLVDGREGPEPLVDLVALGVELGHRITIDEREALAHRGLVQHVGADAELGQALDHGRVLRLVVAEHPERARLDEPGHGARVGEVVLPVLVRVDPI